MAREELVAELREVAHDDAVIDAVRDLVLEMLDENRHKMRARCEQNLQSDAGVCELSMHAHRGSAG